MEAKTEEELRSHFSRGMQLGPDATWDEIDEAIDRLPVNGMVHPQDIRDAITRGRDHLMAMT